MGQIAPPNAGISTGTWTPTPLYPNIDALFSPSDLTSVATSNPAGDAFTVALRPIAFPDANGPQTLLVRAKGPFDVNMSALLLQNGVIVATRGVPLSGTFTTQTFPLSPAEIASISNYAQLQAEIVVGVPLVSTSACSPIPNVAQFFTFSVTGITAGNCRDCPALNGLTFTLAYGGFCQWWAGAPYCSTFHAGAWQFWWNTAASQWQLAFDTGNVVYAASGSGWDGQSPLTLNMIEAHPPGNCSNLPPSITITPLNYNPSSSSSSSSSSGPLAQVSWIQFQAPNHCPGVPTDPTNPLFGQAGGCGCGCNCGGQCGAPPAAPQAPNMAAFPIRYATGEIALVADDIHTDGLGFPWGHARSYANRLVGQPIPPTATTGEGTYGTY